MVFPEVIYIPQMVQVSFTAVIFIFQDSEAVFREQLKSVPEDKMLDVKKFVLTILESHSTPTTYTVSEDGMEVFIRIKEELKEINIKSNHG